MRYGLSGRAYFDDTEFSEVVKVEAEDIIEHACEESNDDNGWLESLLWAYHKQHDISFEVKVTNCEDEEFYVGKFRPVEPQELNKDGSKNKEYYIQHTIWEIQKAYYTDVIDDEEWAQEHIGSVSEHNEDDREYWEDLKYQEWKDTRR